MIVDFDNAMLSKIKAWFTNTVYSPTDKIYNIAYNLADVSAGSDASMSIEFPIIGLYKPSGFSINKTDNMAAKRRGIPFYSANGDTHFARYISVNLPYQLDIYAKSPEELQTITQEIMFALTLYNKLEVVQIDEDTGQEYVELYDITYNNGPVEQSEFQNDDRVYHFALVYEISNARVLNFKPVKNIVSHEIDIQADGEEV